MNTIEITRSAGFTIHPNKSSFTPSQYITYLGFILDSVQIMTITLTLEKKEKLLLKLFQDILEKGTVTIRLMSVLIRNLFATFSAVSLGQFYYRTLQNIKIKVLTRV